MDQGNTNQVFCCVEPVKRSGRVWLIPLIFTAVWLAVLSGIIIKVVLPEMAYHVTAEMVIGCAVLLWLVLVLCVRSSIKRIKHVVQIACEGNSLSVLLSDQTCHCYLMDEITLSVHQVRSISGTAPVRNNHFQMVVRNRRNMIRYNVHVKDDTQFLAYLSNLPCCSR